jgi:DNA-binding transcriptional ArsR family regulator
MKLHDFLDDIFSSKSKIRILRLMFKYPEREFTEREIAKRIGMSQNTVNLALVDLRKTNLMSFQRIGRANVYKLNEKSILNPYIAKMFEDERDIRKKMIMSIERATRSYISCILFGKIVNIAETSDTGIDLLVVVKNKKRVKKEIEGLEKDFLELYGIPLKTVILIPAEVVNKWNSPYLRQLRKNNVVINGKGLDELYDEYRRVKSPN